MEKKTLMHSSIIAAIIIAAVIGIGMATGFSGIHPFASAGPLSDTGTGSQSATTENTPVNTGQFIRIDPVADKTTGDLLIISGSTNLPEGTTLMVKAGHSGGDARVRTGSGGVNRFSSPVDTSCMKPGMTKITVTNMVGDLEKGDYRMGGINTTASFTLKGTYLTTDTPVKATVTKDDFIRINEIGDRSIGDQFLVTGTTSLPVGTEFLWEGAPASLITNPNQTGTMTGFMGNSQVTKGTGNTNRVSFAMDTFELLPERYNVTISTVAGDLSQGDFRTSNPTGSTLFTLKQGQTSVDSAQYIKIDPIADKTTGDLLTVTGSTNLPTGTILMVQAGNYGGDTRVREGTGGVNRFSAPVDTFSFKPGTLTIMVTQMIGNITKGDYRLGTLNGTAIFTLKGAFLAADAPVQPTITKEDYIQMNPISDHSVGDQFLITGTTSLPVGTNIFWQIIQDKGTIPNSIDMTASGIMANNGVTKGDGTSNRVSLAVDMANMAPGKYIAVVSEMKGDMATGDIRMGDLVGSARFTVT